ncbi:hypothetical protein J4573_24055 [Actinomadura barringtoniae]|uniref:Uncharacterized protein n=1 Tax=Actinomadura barringtoniae TaxID=1427535 RepID=A0A939PHH6_9ACTN|nr:hypothetical protein [Actinomadura barringtoniae]MBO2450198.1 hypothetical protein [Actinomadura barringtoniae]
MARKRRVGVVTAISAGAVLAGSQALAGLTWTVVPSPNPSASSNRLNAVSARTATDAWVVGSFTGPDADADGQQMLTARWNGAQWQQVTTPAVLHQDEVLNSVSASGANDAWAVGVTRVVSAAARSPLAIHWNGTAWSIVPVPNSGGSSKSMFNGVATLDAGNAWAVGRGKDARALVEHWDGTAWSVVPVPAPSVPAGSTLASVTLSGVSARSATDIWAVGSFSAVMSTNVLTKSLAMHFDGTSWTVVPTPSNASSTVATALNGVTAVAANDVWSVGQLSTSNGTTLPNTMVIQHWNGTAWSSVTTPALQGGLTGVAARSAGDVWAVGSATDTSGNVPVSKTLTLHWDGSTWTRAASPNGSSGESLVNGVSATPGGGDVWAAGFDISGRTLLLRNSP